MFHHVDWSFNIQLQVARVTGRIHVGDIFFGILVGEQDRT